MAMGGGPPLHRRPRGAGAAETTSWAERLTCPLPRSGWSASWPGGHRGDGGDRGGAQQPFYRSRGFSFIRTVTAEASWLHRAVQPHGCKGEARRGKQGSQHASTTRAGNAGPVPQEQALHKTAPRYGSICAARTLPPLERTAPVRQHSGPQERQPRTFRWTDCSDSGAVTRAEYAACCEATEEGRGCPAEGREQHCKSLIQHVAGRLTRAILHGSAAVSWLRCVLWVQISS
jgi:hypothetical protein